MDQELRALAAHVIAYAECQRASGVISDRQKAGIKIAIEKASDESMVSVLNYCMHALNEIYQEKLTKWIESNRIIIRP